MKTMFKEICCTVDPQLLETTAKQAIGLNLVLNKVKAGTQKRGANSYGSILLGSKTKLYLILDQLSSIVYA